MKSPASLASLVLGAWLILWGILNAPFLHLTFEHSGDILAVLGIVAGVLVLLKR
jgi:hypothetical protein